jgi:cell division septation protein DedD
MSDPSQHDTQDGFHEIQLSGKQLVFLFMATTTVAVLIFLCGVQVGRNVKTDRTADVTDAVASATPPASAAAAPASPASSGPPAAEPPAPAPEPEDELSYAKRLQSDAAPPEKLKSEGATPPASVAARPAPPAPKSAAPSPKTEIEPQSARPSTGRPGNWIVQLTALQDRAAAAAIARRLTTKGYPAFVLDPASGSPAIYRVQVGGYADRHEADQIARRLEKDEQFKTYVRPR